MAPVKFDDIPKVAADVLNEDYQVSGYVFKAKQKASWGGAVLSTQVDLFDAKCATPAKLAWKFPAPFGINALSIDKLEMDKGGKFKLETSSDKAYPGLKLEAKTDLVDASKILVGCTYTGLKDVQLKVETKATKPQDFVGEVTYTYGKATVGTKLTSAVLSGGLPDVGLRIHSGPLFCSITAKDKLAVYSAHGFYKANADFKCAATYQQGGKGGSTYSLGFSYKDLYKVKVAHDQSVSCSAKHSLAKGFTVLGGAKYSLAKGDYSYGLQLSIE